MDGALCSVELLKARCVFRSSHRNLADEFMKLKHGDYVSWKHKRIKAREQPCRPRQVAG